MSNKLVVVLGATGTQGSSVVRALLAHGGYPIRALTRDPSSPSALALSAQGVQLAQGSLTDPASLVRAFEGAFAVFGLTPAFPAEDEYELGKNLVDAAKQAGVGLLIWSSLPSVKDLSEGRYTLDYWDKKAQVDAYLRASGQPGVVLHTGTFAENLTNYHLLHRSPTPSHPNSEWKVTYSVANATARMPGIWIGKDLGRLVVPVIDKWEDKLVRERLEREVLVGAFYDITIDEMVSTLQRVTGEKVVHAPRPTLPGWQQTVNFLSDGFWKFPDQTELLKELGVWDQTHSFEDYVRAEVGPYMQRPVEETLLTH